ncbi:hypothetical protein HK097_001379 [Rhizophlyctis rosea]|uniref:Uncharacterized protein n=1 Tax=Rhizophlyctis rosea TaxID=64517 RepID=A0AAD5S4J2_9FUNG|nr:hypothetical protein HK097_001379 [Rhizophlyctis rosea]
MPRGPSNGDSSPTINYTMKSRYALSLISHVLAIILLLISFTPEQTAAMDIPNEPIILPRVINYFLVMGSGKFAINYLTSYPFMPTNSTPPEITSLMMTINLPRARAAIANSINCTSSPYEEASSAFLSKFDKTFPASLEQYTECQSGDRTLLIQMDYTGLFPIEGAAAGEGIPLVVYHAGRAPELDESEIAESVKKEAELDKDPEFKKAMEEQDRKWANGEL